MTIPRLACVLLGVVSLAAPVIARQAAPAYAVVATLPSAVDGQPLRTFAFDPGRNRIYAGSNRGLFWIDLSDPKPRVKGPFIRKNILHIELAPELSRVFYMTPDEVGYADLDRFGESTQLARDFVPRDIVYEPSKKELYVALREQKLLVFDAQTGRAGDDVPLPGWYATQLEAIPGRVFLSLSDKDGLYVLDAATHRVAAWPVEGRVITPSYIEADPAGHYLFLAFYREIIAIDIARAAVVGRQVTYSTPSIAFDPGERVLVATWNAEPPPTRVAAFRVDASGLAEVARFENPRVGEAGVEPTSHGFIQNGHLALLVWSSTGHPPPQ
jgi:hypothetical protein